MGALAIIRFRNVVKDTRDIVFIFCALVVGMAAGSQRYAIAVLGTIMLSLIVIFLHMTAFGTRQPHNGFLRFSLLVQKSEFFLCLRWNSHRHSEIIYLI